MIMTSVEGDRTTITPVINGGLLPKRVLEDGRRSCNNIQIEINERVNRTRQVRNGCTAGIGAIKRGDFDRRILHLEAFNDTKEESALCVVVNSHSNFLHNELGIKYSLHSERYTGNFTAYINYVFAFLGISENGVEHVIPGDSLDAILFMRMDEINVAFEKLFLNAEIALNSKYVKMMICYLKRVMDEGILKCDAHGTFLKMRKAIAHFEGTHARIANVLIMFGDYSSTCVKCQKLCFLNVMFTCWNGYEESMVDENYGRFLAYLSSMSMTEKAKKARCNDMLESVLTHIIMMKMHYDNSVTGLSLLGLNDKMRTRHILVAEDTTDNKPLATKLISMLISSEQCGIFSMKSAKYNDSNADKIVLTAYAPRVAAFSNDGKTYFSEMLTFTYMLHVTLFNRIGVLDYSMVRYDRFGPNAFAVGLAEISPTIMRTSNAICGEAELTKVQVMPRHRLMQSAVVSLTIELSKDDMEGVKDEIMFSEMSVIIADVIMGGQDDRKTIVRPNAGERRHQYVFNRIQAINYTKIEDRVKLLHSVRDFPGSVLQKTLHMYFRKKGMVASKFPSLISADIMVTIPAYDGGIRRLVAQAQKIY